MIHDMTNYYYNNLAAERLKHCYEIASPRVRQYLNAEISYVIDKIHKDDLVLELGCGYGRALKSIAQKSGTIIGIDISLSSLVFGTHLLNKIPNCSLANMNAIKLAFTEQTFDVVICIQNGISAFQVNQRDLIAESIRVVKTRGTILFSSYSDKFWPYRLEWFQSQSKAGLIGKIDFRKTGNGIIVCDDGFEATTVRPDEFVHLLSDHNVKINITEVDESSIFYEMIKL